MPPHQILVPCRLCRNLFTACVLLVCWILQKFSLPCLYLQMYWNVHGDTLSLLNQVTDPAVLFTIFLFSCKILYRTTALPSSLYLFLERCYTGPPCLMKVLILDHSPVCIFLLCKSSFYHLHLSLFLVAGAALYLHWKLLRCLSNEELWLNPNKCFYWFWYLGWCRVRNCWTPPTIGPGIRIGPCG